VPTVTISGCFRRGVVVVMDVGSERVRMTAVRMHSVAPLVQERRWDLPRMRSWMQRGIRTGMDGRQGRRNQRIPQRSINSGGCASSGTGTGSRVTIESIGIVVRMHRYGSTCSDHRKSRSGGCGTG